MFLTSRKHHAMNQNTVSCQKEAPSLNEAKLMCAQDVPLETTPWFSGVNTMARAAMSLVTIHIE